MADVSTKFMLEGIEYDSDQLTEAGTAHFKALKFSNRQIDELQHNHQFLVHAKHSYIQRLKKSILADKSGFLIDGN